VGNRHVVVDIGGGRLDSNWYPASPALGILRFLLYRTGTQYMQSDWDGFQQELLLREYWRRG
jgi:hypothetical protein